MQHAITEIPKTLLHPITDISDIIYLVLIIVFGCMQGGTER